MKLLTIAFAVALTIGSAFANSVDTISVHFANPVMVGEKMLPAGDATLSLLRGSSNIVVLNVRAENGETAAVAVNRITTLDETTRTSVVLGKHGNILKLEKIWLDDQSGFEVFLDTK